MGLKLKWYKRPAHNGETISSNLIGPTNLIFESEQLATVVRTSMDLLPLFTLPKLKTLATSVAFAERITANKAPRILDVEGFFFSIWWCVCRLMLNLNIFTCITRLFSVLFMCGAQTTGAKLTFIGIGL